MQHTQDKVELTLTSRPPLRRHGLVPLFIALSVGIVLSLMWFTVAIFVFFHHHIIGFILAITALGYASYALLIGYRMISDMNQHFKLELTPSEIILTTFNVKKQKKYFKMLLLDDIKLGEYYPYSDSACIILYTGYAEMEIPLWSLPLNGQDVVDYLLGRGIKIVNVQFDDKIPE